MTKTNFRDGDIIPLDSWIEEINFLEKVYTEDEKREISIRAEQFFDHLFEELVKIRDEEKSFSSLRVINSLLVAKKHVREHVFSESKNCFVEREKVEPVLRIDNNYYQIFVSKLKELGRTKNCFLMMEKVFDEEREAYFLKAKIYNERGYMLEYKRNLEILKANYIRFREEDERHGFGQENVFRDGYLAMMMLNDSFKELGHREEILDSMDFFIDEKNQRLLLGKR